MTRSSRWFPHPQFFPALNTGEPCYVVSCDPGAKTGLALLACVGGYVHCGVATLSVTHPAAWRPTVDAVEDTLMTLLAGGGPFAGATDPRGLPWALACELSSVHVRGGEAKWSQVNAANSLTPNAYTAGTVLAALAHLLGVADPPGVAHPQTWRRVLGKANMGGEAAKRAALRLCSSLWGAEWPVPARVNPGNAEAYRVRELSHEAEAACIGLWRLREWASGATARRTRSLPEAVLAAMKPVSQNRPVDAPEGPEAG